MKIPNDWFLIDTYAGTGREIVDTWQRTAIQLSMKTGIFVAAYAKYRDDVINGKCIDEIVFECMGHEFGNLKDLRMAIKNKIFL
jgi:hypothetical protein